MRRTAPALHSWLTVLLAAFAVGAVEFLALPQANAGGFFIPGRGVRPMGRAGAYVASGEGNLNSLWYNPANLHGMEGLTFTGDLSLITSFVEHQRSPRVTDSGNRVTYPAVSNDIGPHPDPQLLIGGPIGGGDDGEANFSWAAGLYAPYAGKFRFPEDGPQRYVVIDNSSSTLAYIHAALAWQPKDWLRVGLGFQNMPARFELVNVISGYSGLYGRPEDRDLDILSRVVVEDYFNPTGNLGIWANPVANLETAFSLQLPALIRDNNATLDVRMPSHPSFDNAELSNDTVAGELNFPLILRLAVRWSEPDWDVELAATMEGWSTFDEIQVEPNSIEVDGVPGVGAIPVGALSIPQNWQNTWSVRLGGHYDFTDAFAMRAGYTFETGAIPDDYYSLFAPDPNKHVFGAGVSFDFGKLELDVSSGYYALNNKRIADSNVTQINPIDADDELATTVGNGSYRSSHFIVGAGVNYTF